MPRVNVEGWIGEFARVAEARENSATFKRTDDILTIQECQCNPAVAIEAGSLPKKSAN